MRFSSRCTIEFQITEPTPYPADDFHFLVSKYFSAYSFTKSTALCRTLLYIFPWHIFGFPQHTRRTVVFTPAFSDALKAGGWQENYCSLQKVQHSSGSGLTIVLQQHFTYFAFSLHPTSKLYTTH